MDECISSQTGGEVEAGWMELHAESPKRPLAIIRYVSSHPKFLYLTHNMQPVQVQAAFQHFQAHSKGTLVKQVECPVQLQYRSLFFRSDGQINLP